MRLLFPEEIEDILSVFDDNYLGLDEAARTVLLEQLKAPLRVRLEKVEIDPGIKYKLKAEIARMYRAVEPGKSVGIITAQSVGEMQTQMNLNIFHQAGHRDQNTEKASRLQELTCTSKSKTQSAPTCTIIFNAGQETNEQMMRAIIYKTFEHYILRYELEKRANAAAADWEETYLEFYQKSIAAEFKWRHAYYLNAELLYRFRLDLETIVERLAAAASDIALEYTFSPIFMGRINVYARTARDLKIAHKIFAAIILHGIAGIKHAYFVPKTAAAGVYIETEGSNLAEIFRLPFVDVFETSSNDMWEIYEIFGIEAARQFLIEEFELIMPGVDSSHIELLADRMTVSGKLRSMTRYTRKSETRASVLSKLTFEETMKRSTEAAFKAQIDHVIGCSSSVICGRPPSVGAGLNKLLFQY